MEDFKQTDGYLIWVYLNFLLMKFSLKKNIPVLCLINKDVKLVSCIFFWELGFAHNVDNALIAS